MIKILILALAVAAVSCSEEGPSDNYHTPPPPEHYPQHPKEHYPKQPKEHYPKAPKEHYPQPPKKHYPDHHPEPENYPEHKPHHENYPEHKPKPDNYPEHKPRPDNYPEHQPENYESTESPSSDYGEIIQPRDRKPVYNILADASSTEKIRRNLNGYFNGLKTVLNFDNKYFPSHVSDQSPCECNVTCGESENWNVYLNQLRRWTEPENPEYRQEVVVLVLEVNITRLDNNGQYLAGQYLAEDLARILYKDGLGTSQLVVVIQVRNKKNEPFVRGFLDARKLGKINDQANKKIENQVGWTFGCHVDSIADTYNFFIQKNVTNLWFSVGRSNCFSVQYPLIRFHKAVQKRLIDVRDVKVNKVLTFTLDRQIDQINVLILEVDAVVTHRVNLLWKILQEPRFFYKYRLANQKDHPWANLDNKPGYTQPEENWKLDDQNPNV